MSELYLTISDTQVTPASGLFEALRFEIDEKTSAEQRPARFASSEPAAACTDFRQRIEKPLKKQLKHCFSQRQAGRQ